VSDNKNLARKVQVSLKDLGHEIPLGHCYELLAKLSGFASYNVAKAKNASLADPILSKPDKSGLDQGSDFLRLIQPDGGFNSSAVDEMLQNGLASLQRSLHSLGFDPVVRRHKEKLKKVYFYLWAEHFQDMKTEDLAEEIRIAGMRDDSDRDILDALYSLYQENRSGLDFLLRKFDLDDVARREILSTLFDKASVEVNPNAHSVFNLKTEEQDFLSFISQAEKQHL